MPQVMLEPGLRVSLNQDSLYSKFLTSGLSDNRLTDLDTLLTGKRNYER